MFLLYSTVHKIGPHKIDPHKLGRRSYISVIPGLERRKKTPKLCFIRFIFNTNVQYQ